MVRDSKLYDLLEINTNANENDIKKAYKKLSFKWHPDKNPDNTDLATAKFQEISEAYAILSDKEKRERYDNEGYDSLKNPIPNFNPEDIFQQFFGGAGGFSGFGGFGGFGGFDTKQKPMEHCTVEKEVTLEDLFTEKVVTVSFKQKTFCKKCNGNGTKDGTTGSCNGCKGSGKKVQVIQRGNTIQQMVSNCNECNGSGETVSKNNSCDECKGVKYTIKDKNVELQLNKNYINGKTIVLDGKGHIFKNNKTNLIIQIKELPHNVFKRNGKDLHINIKLKMFQTIFGFTKSIQHLDGRNLLIKYDTLSKTDTILEIKNEGMGGHLYLHLSTSIPNTDKLEENERSILKKLLIKINLSEYQKETAISKISNQYYNIPSNNINEVIITTDNSEPREPPQQQSHNFEGAQCAQQ